MFLLLQIEKGECCDDGEAIFALRILLNHYGSAANVSRKPMGALGSHLRYVNASKPVGDLNRFASMAELLGGLLNYLIYQGAIFCQNRVYKLVRCLERGECSGAAVTAACEAVAPNRRPYSVDQIDLILANMLLYCMSAVRAALFVREID